VPYVRKTPQLTDQERQRRYKALHWYGRYRCMLEAAGLSANCNFEDFVTLLRAQGALAALAALDARDERLVTPSDNDRRRRAVLIATGERCLREHQPNTKED
jgi:hypothetical protein